MDHHLINIRLRPCAFPKYSSGCCRSSNVISTLSLRNLQFNFKYLSNGLLSLQFILVWRHLQWKLSLSRARSRSKPLLSNRRQSTTVHWKQTAGVDVDVHRETRDWLSESTLGRMLRSFGHLTTILLPSSTSLMKPTNFIRTVFFKTVTEPTFFDHLCTGLPITRRHAIL